jgi:hypothetical protein
MGTDDSTEKLPLQLFHPVYIACEPKLSLVEDIDSDLLWRRLRGLI